MKRNQTLFHWIFTLPVAALMLVSAIGLLAPWDQNIEGMIHLGYPLYFMMILGTAKALGTAALLYKHFRTLTEWAYAGFTFTFLSASYSHYSSGDGVAKTMMPFVILALLAGSYYFWKKDLSSTR